MASTPAPHGPTALDPDQGPPGRAPQNGQVLCQQQEAERDHPEPQEGQDAEDAAGDEQGSDGEAPMVAVQIVEDVSFEAVEAAGATAAVRILEERPDVRVVFTDIDMPGGLGGMGLATAVRDRRPPIEIILTSGHVAPSRAELPVWAVFLPKPYRESGSWPRCGAWRPDRAAWRLPTRSGVAPRWERGVLRAPFVIFGPAAQRRVDRILARALVARSFTAPLGWSGRGRGQRLSV